MSATKRIKTRVKLGVKTVHVKVMTVIKIWITVKCEFALWWSIKGKLVMSLQVKHLFYDKFSVKNHIFYFLYKFLYNYFYNNLFIYIIIKYGMFGLCLHADIQVLRYNDCKNINNASFILNRILFFDYHPVWYNLYT